MTTQITNFVDLDELIAAVGPDAEIMLVQGGQTYRVTVSRLPGVTVQKDGVDVASGQIINFTGNVTVTEESDGTITVDAA